MVSVLERTLDLNSVWINNPVNTKLMSRPQQEQKHSSVMGYGILSQRHFSRPCRRRVSPVRTCRGGAFPRRRLSFPRRREDDSLRPRQCQRNRRIGRPSAGTHCMPGGQEQPRRGQTPLRIHLGQKRLPRSCQTKRTGQPARSRSHSRKDLVASTCRSLGCCSANGKWAWSSICSRSSAASRLRLDSITRTSVPVGCRTDIHMGLKSSPNLANNFFSLIFRFLGPKLTYSMALCTRTKGSAVPGSSSRGSGSPCAQVVSMVTRVRSRKGIAVVSMVPSKAMPASPAPARLRAPTSGNVRHNGPVVVVWRTWYSEWIARTGDPPRTLLHYNIDDG